ncbi:MAG: hypothetical protein ABIB43_01810 [archaeon]
MTETQMEWEMREKQKKDLMIDLQKKGIIRTFYEDDSFIGYKDTRTGDIFPEEKDVYAWYSH